jgi:sodium/bile acid cotransporter 7
MSPEETIAVCFCGPAKSTALGIPLLYAMWQPVDLFTKAKTSVPVLLYTTEQICVAHFFVQLFKRWHARIIEKEHSDGPIPDDAEIDVAGASSGVHPGPEHELSTV